MKLRKGTFIVVIICLCISNIFSEVTLDNINYLDKIISDKNDLKFYPSESVFKSKVKRLKKNGYQINWTIPGDSIEAYVNEINEMNYTLRVRKLLQNLGFIPLEHCFNRKTKLLFYEDEHLYRIEYDNEPTRELVGIKKHIAYWLKRDLVFNAMYCGTHELNSDLNQNITLDARIYKSVLEKKLFDLYELKIYAGLGLCYAEFAYDNRSYIFKNGPEFIMNFKIVYEKKFNSQILMQSSIDLLRSNLEGDEFENRVDSRQGEPSVSGMDLSQSKFNLLIKYNTKILKEINGYLTLEAYRVSKKVDMEIGWRSNEREIMKTENPYGAGIYMHLKPKLWQHNHVLNIKAGYDLNDGFQCGISKELIL